MPALYGLPRYAETYRINDYKANNPYVVDLDGFEIDYQTRFWYLPNLLRDWCLTPTIQEQTQRSNIQEQ